MSDFDSKINAALSAEDEQFLDNFDNEPGYFSQAFGLFRGTLGWISWVIMIVQSAMFLVGVWMAINFFAAGDSVTQLRWGLPAAVLILAAAQMKLSLMPTMQANRVIRELRRLELMLGRAD